MKIKVKLIQIQYFFFFFIGIPFTLTNFILLVKKNNFHLKNN